MKSKGWVKSNAMQCETIETVFVNSEDHGVKCVSEAAYEKVKMHAHDSDGSLIHSSLIGRQCSVCIS